MSIAKKRISGKPLAWMLTLVYFSSYITRINFSAIIQEIITQTGFEKSTLSIILTVLSITYGTGQIVNGILGDKIKPQNLIFTGMIVAVSMNLLLPIFSYSVPMMTVLWGINGFAQAMMWPPMVKILVSSCDDAMYSYSVVRISWGSSFGTIFVYLTAPLIISLAGWKAVFYICAACGLAVTVVWGFLKSGIDGECTEKAKELPVTQPTEQQKFRFPRASVFPLILIALGIVFQGMLRDGVTSWMPTYLAENFEMDNSASILLTVSLAIFSIVIFTFAGWLYKRFFTNEVACGGVFFITAALASCALFIFFKQSGVLFSVLMMMLITGCMHGINLMLVTHVPKRFKKYGNISTVSGLVNACTYVGSAVFTYGVAVLVEQLGWRITVGVWGIIAILGTLCCLIAMKPWKKFFQSDAES